MKSEDPGEGNRQLGSVVALMLLGLQGGWREPNCREKLLGYCKGAGKAGPVSSSLDGDGQKGATKLKASCSRE